MKTHNTKKFEKWLTHNARTAGTMNMFRQAVYASDLKQYLKQ